jgi:homoserine O-succinyltransferase/O-acetyltransferase
MPVYLDSTYSSCDRHGAASGAGNCAANCAAKRWPGRPLAELTGFSGECLRIGLINNMPDSALEGTERQFLALLDAASGDVPVRVSFYALDGVPRAEASARYVQEFYTRLDELWDANLDGLIVTGREPLAAELDQEPYWESFARVVDWARENTRSTVWSCLAAHAALLHTDGIRRVRSETKQFGIFECARVTEHPLTAGLPGAFRIPHSRWNGLREEELNERGYQVLTRAEGVGVDTFVKQGRHLAVFFQGHPEYEVNTLLLEYRRDVGRYLRGERETYPLPPRHYFEAVQAQALDELARRAMGDRSVELMAHLTAILRQREVENTWQGTATGMYRNWLRYLREQKDVGVGRGAIAAGAEYAPIANV